MEINSVLKLRPSVALVIGDDFTEFFNSNTREILRLEINPEISNLLFKFDGILTVGSFISDLGNGDEDVEGLMLLLDYLNERSVLINVDVDYPKYAYSKFKRVFNLLEDYYLNQSDVIKAFEKITKSHVVIVGLGAVGTWVGQCLAMSGVQNFTFIDPDNVSLSNLHRQFGYKEQDVNCKKTISFTKNIRNLDDNIKCNIINKELSFELLNSLNHKYFDLVINCADFPTVDRTSQIIGEFCMENDIKHIIGGGYNLHQSLIGQVVFPGKTACVECFKMHLEEINEIDTNNIQKLENKDRKVGSFPPLSALSASIAANEAFKILANLQNFSMINKRTEFSTQDLNFSNLQIDRRLDCKWCGTHGKYFNL
ncbi:HesA/MoeB/ThiF family protein [Myroides phaeus]|uniref:HesA/MoeB/ThiF family protein n=1 Tax=Myroides phaeus TaxID=702745 RepID=UPI001303AA4C|nr:ThiF family adenylyltransferase [Myroides phaeus]